MLSTFEHPNEINIIGGERVRSQGIGDEWIEKSFKEEAEGQDVCSWVVGLGRVVGHVSWSALIHM